jgi:hypothetical protein
VEFFRLHLAASARQCWQSNREIKNKFKIEYFIFFHPKMLNNMSNGYCSLKIILHFTYLMLISMLCWKFSSALILKWICLDPDSSQIFFALMECDWWRLQLLFPISHLAKLSKFEKKTVLPWGMIPYNWKNKQFKLAVKHLIHNVLNIMQMLTFLFSHEYFVNPSAN